MTHGVAASPSQAACRVCGALSRFVYSRRLLGRPVRYYDCAACGYFQTEEPDWLERAYRSPINVLDTGLVRRNALNVGRVVMTLALLRRLRGRVVDIAGGVGLLVRMLRDLGVDAYWQDRYCENLLARGFEDSGLDCALVTAIEVVEHLVRPGDDLRAMLERGPTVLFSTELVTSVDPPPGDWWYLGLEHGQHVGFFRRRTLEHIADALGCHFDTDGTSLHILSRRRIPRGWSRLVNRARTSALVARLLLRSRTVDDFEWLRRRHAAAQRQSLDS